MEDRQHLEALQWLAYNGRTRNNVTRARHRREVCLDEEPNLKVDGHRPEIKSLNT